MPQRAWSAKDERMYSSIKKSCVTRSKSPSPCKTVCKQRRTKRCERIAAATVNKRRREEGRTLGRVPRMANVETENRKHPKTFLIMPREQRAALEPGDSAKVIFREKGKGERIWLQVTKAKRNGKTRYEGTVDNEPVVFEDLKYGERVSFGPEHVAEAIGKDTPSPLAVLAAVGIAVAGGWLLFRAARA